MEFLGYLAPIAFIFALSAQAQAGALKKEVQELRDQINRLTEQVTRSEL